MTFSNTCNLLFAKLEFFPKQVFLLLWLAFTIPCFCIFAIFFANTLRYFPAGFLFFHSILISFYLAGILSIVPLIFPVKGKYWVTGIFAVLSLFFGITLIVSFLHYYVFKTTLRHFSFQSALQTNPNETAQFFEMYGSWDVLTITGVFIVGLLLLFWVTRKKIITSLKTPAQNKVQMRWGIVVCLFLIVFTYIDIKRSIRHQTHFLSHYAVRSVYEFGVAVNAEMRVAELVKQADNPADFGTVALLNPEEPKTYVVIIGEGSSRAHMSLYGYTRPTSPEFDAIKDSLYLFTNVISLYGSTAKSLNESWIFTSIQDGEKDKKGKVIQEATFIASLLSLHNQAGFKTFWLSNNVAEKGNGAAWFNVTANVIINKNLAVTFTEKSTYDEVLLPEFDEILKDPAPHKFIVIHVAGQHPTYDYRYPPSFAEFDKDTPVASLYNTQLSEKEKTTISKYDNAMRYNNWVVAQIFEKLHNTKESAYVLFTSDHSQQLGEIPNMAWGYSAQGHSPYLYEVPFILWLSPQYKHNNPDIVGLIPQRFHSFFKLDEGFATSVAHLSGILYGKFDAQKSLFAAEFKEPNSLLGENAGDYRELATLKK